jgi:hypothetical protein
MCYRLSLENRIINRIGKTRRTFQVDTNNTRAHLVKQLEELFQIASDYASGKNDSVVIENKKTRLLTISERQLYTRLATYAAQSINNIAKGIDERQIDEDLKKLEEILNKKPATNEVSSSNGDGESPRKPEGT